MWFDPANTLGRAASAVAALAGFSVLMAALTGPAHPDPGPVAADYAPIADAPAVAPEPPTRSYALDCGRNADGHRNPDNVITAPGTPNGAHHLHDYVGNRSADARSTDRTLAAAPTTCAGGDRSVYFWPVLRTVADGRVLGPAAVRIEFLGNAYAPVRPMPRFLRLVTGDAKAHTRGPANARARWSCAGTPGRAFADRYPLCPAGQLVRRTAEFPSCWTGAGTDSPDHRGHALFPVAGRCPAGTVPVPRLRVTLTYAVPPGRSYAVDSFPDQLHKPATDHFDFINVMPAPLARRVVDVLNAGWRTPQSR